ncbi:MAG: LacI family DNA-binding transcriptional regulator, partial [Bacteroidota bacterium]
SRMAVEHLIRLGHRDIGFVGGIPNLLVVQDRLAGYKQALETYGLPLREEWVVETDFTELSGLVAVRSLLNQRPRPTALFCVDDLLAIAALQAAEELGLHVPEDVAVLGVNDDPLAKLVRPRLTTIRVPMTDMGAVAAQLLLTQLGDIPNPFPSHQVILPVELVVRESCGSWRVHSS